MIETSAGSIQIGEPDPELLLRLNELWPMGVYELPEGSPTAFGIGFQKGEQEVCGVKLQQIEHSEEEAQQWTVLHRMAITEALSDYVSIGYGGILIACPYAREKAEDFVEPGIAFFAAPDPSGKECTTPSEHPHVDDRLGAGSWCMISAMAGAIAKSQDRLQVPKPVIIGVDVRPRLALGQILLEFMMFGEKVICLQQEVLPDDPAWEALAKGDVREVTHLPSITIALYPDQET